MVFLATLFSRVLYWTGLKRWGWWPIARRSTARRIEDELVESQAESKRNRALADTYRVRIFRAREQIAWLTDEVRARRADPVKIQRGLESITGILAGG